MDKSDGDHNSSQTVLEVNGSEQLPDTRYVDVIRTDVGLIVESKGLKEIILEQRKEKGTSYTRYILVHVSTNLCFFETPPT